MNSAVKDSLSFLPEYLKSNHVFTGQEDIFVIVQKLAIALLIGFLIGLEREHSRQLTEKTFAGIRTNPLISILGFVAALISSYFSLWYFIIIFIGFASLVSVSHVFSAREGRYGATSEISALLVFLLGALVYWNFVIIAAIIAVVVMAFLTLKIPLHRFAGKVSEEDLYATLKLAVITIIVLPLLPNKTVGPLDILNPRMIWLMVIFVSGISFIGYVLTKLLGEDRGITITGLLGGLASSTATTFSFAKKSTEVKELSNNYAIGIVMASSVMFIRTFIIILTFNKNLLRNLWLPLIIFAFAGVFTGLLLQKKIEGHDGKSIEIENPFKLKSALVFGTAFAIIIFVSKAAQVYLGHSGIYAASAVAGITSIDAIVLTISELFTQNLSEKVAVAGILIALISNNLIKAFISIIWGTSNLKKYAVIGLASMSILPAIYLIYVLIS